jgi:hypothetical protein
MYHFFLGLKKFTNKFFYELADNFFLNYDVNFFELTKYDLNNSILIYITDLIYYYLNLNSLKNFILKFLTILVKNFNINFILNLNLINKKLYNFLKFNIKNLLNFKSIKFSYKDYGFLKVNSLYFYMSLPKFIIKKYK